MSQEQSTYSIPSVWQFVKTSLFVAIISAGICAIYFLIYESLSETPIPSPYDLQMVIYQTVFIVAINGLIHAGYRKRRTQNTYWFLFSTIVLLGVNLFMFLVLMDVRMMPSINEMEALYGVRKVPDVLLFLSAPIALVPCALGILMIPALVYKKVRNEVDNTVRPFQVESFRLFLTYSVIAAAIILINSTYFMLYKSSGGEMNEAFSYWTMIQMNLIMTGVASVLYMYLRAKMENGFAMYVILTICFTASVFFAGLPHPDGQPVYDESLWLNVPLSLISLFGELVGVPYVYSRLEKRSTD